MLNFTPTILKNLLSKSSTRLYPFETREPFKNVRGELRINIEECKLCGICAKKCPVNCIKVDKKTGLWEVNPFECVYCGICVDNCPTNCLYFKSEYQTPNQTKHLKTFHKIEKN
ncbi:4Fe-4S binding protein [Desulfonauticus submarinus]